MRLLRAKVAFRCFRSYVLCTSVFLFVTIYASAFRSNWICVSYDFLIASSRAPIVKAPLDHACSVCPYFYLWLFMRVHSNQTEFCVSYDFLIASNHAPIVKAPLLHPSGVFWWRTVNYTAWEINCVKTFHSDHFCKVHMYMYLVHFYKDHLAYVLVCIKGTIVCPRC